VGQVRPLWGAEPRGIGCRTDRHAPAGAPRGQHVHTPLPATLYPHRQAKPTPQSSASGRDTWPNEASERWVRAPTPCASPRSVSLATTWGFARRGPGGEDADGGTREINGCTHHAAATDRPTASHSAAETSPHSWVSFNTLPIVYAMMAPRMCLPAEPQGGKRRGRLCRGGGSGRARERPVLDPWPTMGVARRAVEAERGPSAGEPGWSHAP